MLSFLFDKIADSSRFKAAHRILLPFLSLILVIIHTILLFVNSIYVL